MIRKCLDLGFLVRDFWFGFLWVLVGVGVLDYSSLFGIWRLDLDISWA